MLDQIIAVVRQAGEMIRGAHQIEKVTREKENSAANLVTQYDEAVQSFLKKELLAIKPDADFFGEEGEHQALTAPWTYVVDPIDGTTNFVREMKYSSIAVALCREGQVQYAVVYNPFDGELYAAERGKGATLNGQPIHVSQRDLSHAIILCGSTIYQPENTDRSFAIMRHLYDKGLDIRRFGAAEQDACRVAAGRAEIFFECCLSPWDFAASSLIVEEAGGHLTRLDGTAIDPREPGSIWCTNDVCFESYRDLPE